MYKTNWQKQMQADAETLGISISVHQAKQLALLMAELKQWNQHINLTALKTTEDIVVKHFLDSMTVLEHLPEKSRVADLGSGAGFPGLPVKIMRPDLTLVMLESNRKKSNFIRHMIRTLSLPGVKVFNGRVEAYRRTPGFDCAVSRAFAGVNKYVSLAAPLVNPGGRIICMLGPAAGSGLRDGDLPQWGAKKMAEHTLALPRNKGRRTLLILQKCFT